MLVQEKNIAHSGNLKLNDIIEIARVMRDRSCARYLSGTCKEILGTCVSVGCTVEGEDPQEMIEKVCRLPTCLCLLVFACLLCVVCIQFGAAAAGPVLTLQFPMVITPRASARCCSVFHRTNCLHTAVACSAVVKQFVFAADQRWRSGDPRPVDHPVTDSFVIL